MSEKNRINSVDSAENLYYTVNSYEYTDKNLTKVTSGFGSYTVYTYDAFDRVVFASFHADVSREFKRMKNDRLVPDTFMYSPGIVSIVKYYALATLGIDSLYHDSISVLQIPVEKLGFRFDLERIVRSAHEHNLAVQYWTVNDEE